MKTKTLLTVIVFTAAFALPADAQQRLMRPELLAPEAILPAVKAMGLNPAGEPTRHGDYYMLKATDSRGAEVRVLVDALYGDVLNVSPPRGAPKAALPDANPRIIHVPVPAERPMAALPQPAKTDAKIRPVPTPPIKKPIAAPKPEATLVLPKAKPAPLDSPPPPEAKLELKQAELPPQPSLPSGFSDTKRTVLSAPLQFNGDGPSPIRRLPRWRELNDTRPVELGVGGIAFGQN
ncbi:MAG: hypothetical protein JO205_03690 [Pseudolabrys sp.]|nr:hypothetical protein [Pseudolabrys sp.]